MKIDEKTVICKSCGIPKKKIRVPREDGKDFWKDSRGFLWNGNTCRDCQLVTKRQRRRKSGILPREEISEPRFVKAVEAEKLVGSWFERKGFAVEYTKVNGPDLTCIAGPVTLRVEVKSVTPYAVKGKTYWRTGQVQPNRVGDDLVAIVLPSGRIHFEEMKTHLLKCDIRRQRQVARLVQEDMNIGSP